MSKNQYKVTNEKYVVYNLKSALMGDLFDAESGLTFKHGNIGVGEGFSMFGTFTFRRKIYSPSEANKYFSRFLGLLRKKLKRKGYDFLYFWVVESHKKGGCHYHVLISCPPFDSSYPHFSTTRFNDLVKSTIKKSKMPLGYINQCVWTFSRSYEPVAGMQYAFSRGEKYWKDRTPKKDLDSVKGVVGYLVKYLVKSLGEYSDKGIKARAYGFSKNFPLQYGRNFTDLDNNYFRKKALYLDQIKKFYFPKTFEKFHWYRYSDFKEIDENGKEYVDKIIMKLHRSHLSDVREIRDRYTDLCNRSSGGFYDDDSVGFFDSVYDIMSKYSFVNESDLNADKERFENKISSRLKQKFKSFFPTVYEVLPEEKRLTMLSMFRTYDLDQLANDGARLLSKMQMFLLSIKDSVPVNSIKSDLKSLKLKLYLKDVPF